MGKITIVFLGDKFLKDVDKGISKGMLGGSEILSTNVAKHTPVLTGVLRSSIEPSGEILKKVTSKSGKFETTAGTEVEYAAAVNYGRPDQPNRKAHHMFEFGAEASKETILNFIKRFLPK